MAFKKAKHNIEEETNDWLLSYADMITLLFTFFVVLFSISNPDMVKIKLLSNYFAKEKTMSYSELQKKIEEFIVNNNVQEQVEVNLTNKGVEISFKDKLLFTSGEAVLKTEAEPVLKKISELLQYQQITDRRIIVEGHTDSVPMKSEIFPSNWELSSGRAASVVRFFVSKGLLSERFESIGYADTKPLTASRTPYKGQPKNRRVVVVISPESYNYEVSRKTVRTSDRAADKKIIESKINEGNKEDTVSLMKQYFMSGQTEFKNKNYEKAIEFYKKVLEIKPDHSLSAANIKRAQEALKLKQ